MSRYVFLGDRLADPQLILQPCDPVLSERFWSKVEKYGPIIRPLED